MRAGEPPALYRMEVDGGVFAGGLAEVMGKMDHRGAVHIWTLRVPD